MTPLSKVVLAGNVVKAMSGNPDFPDAGPLLAELDAARLELAEANKAALDRGRLACARKRVAVSRVNLIFTRVVGYVNSVALGDSLKLLSSGLPLAKKPEPFTELRAPKEFDFRPSQFLHLVQAYWDDVPGAVMYRVEAAPVNGSDESWQQVALTSRREATVPRSINGASLQFRVRAVGTQVEGPYSNVKTLTAA